jgi:hypothetical protein
VNAAEHLERHLGPMEGGWSSASCPGVQICLFRNQPSAGVLTFATLGLSNTTLAMSQDRTVRQELLLAVRDDRLAEEVAKLLFHVADLLIRRKGALLRGEVIHIGDSIGGGRADALYAAIPVAFPQDLATLECSSPPTVVVWLVPLQPAEVAFVESCGWSEFEHRLEAADPDLFDLSRSSVIST